MKRALERRSYYAPLESLFISTRLTAAERRVLKLILAGWSCRKIAELLGRAVRTIEEHRKHIMDKFGAHNAVILVERLNAMKWMELPKSRKQTKSNPKRKKSKKLKMPALELVI